MPRRILGRVLPKAAKYGRVILPERRSGAGVGGFQAYEPVKIRVEQIGAEVFDIAVGDVLVLANHELDYVAHDLVIIPYTVKGSYYHRETLRQFRSKDEIRRAKDSEVIGGIIHYIEEPAAEAA
jgi:hypothetical protein